MILQVWYSAKIRVQCDGTQPDGRRCTAQSEFLGDSLASAITQTRQAGWKVQGPTTFCSTCPVDHDLDTNLEISPGPDGFPIWRRLRGGPIPSHMPPDKPKTMKEHV